jgi:hypothetical protein
MSENVRNSVLLIAFVSVGFIEPVQAYLDPSTGSMLLSAVIGMLATLGLVVKTYWYKLKSFFRKTPQEHNKEQ